MAASYQDHMKTLDDAGVSKTVYALVMPESEAVANAVIADNGTQAREDLLDMHRAAWTHKQDATHEEFFSTWQGWSSPIVSADWSAFPHIYPSCGASEALREAINAYGTKAFAEGRKPVIHIFEGEYEGFAAYAQAAHIEVKTHRRDRWQEALDDIGPGEQFYLSQPSAIDGNVWDDYDAFARSLNEAQPAAELMLDLTYVGCVAREFTVKADYPNIPAVFFSLSKPAGAYYHRIGGCLSREPYGGLYGNMWFKNLLSLRIGTEFMRKYGVYDLPRKYRPVQEQAAAIASEKLGRKLGVTLSAPDVMLLATAKPTEAPSELETLLTRGSGDEAVVRMCVTPTMAYLIDPRLNKDYKPASEQGTPSP